MKKHDEGYALVFVLVVMAVLGIVATTLMTGAMKNLQAQNTSLFQMQAKYKAQGEIEKTVQLIENSLQSEGTNLWGTAEGVHPEVENYLIGNNEVVWDADVANDIRTLSSKISSAEWKVPQKNGKEHLEWSEDDCSCFIVLESEKDGVLIQATISLMNIVQYDSNSGKWFFGIYDVVYTSYTIEYMDTSATEEVPSE